MNLGLKSQHKMNASPWKEWIPGALNNRQLKQLIDGRFIKNAVGCGIDYSSFDLRLDRDVYEMVEGSVKPHGGGYEQFLKTQKRYAKKVRWEQNGEIILKPAKTYVFAGFKMISPFCSQRTFFAYLFCVLRNCSYPPPCGFTEPSTIS